MGQYLYLFTDTKAMTRLLLPSSHISKLRLAEVVMKHAEVDMKHAEAGMKLETVFQVSRLCWHSKVKHVSDSSHSIILSWL